MGVSSAARVQLRRSTEYTTFMGDASDSENDEDVVEEVRDKGADSSEDSDEEDVGDKHLEEVTLDTLQGTWKHSLGMTVRVKGDRIKFIENKEKYDLTPSGNSVEMITGYGNWIAKPETSSGSTIRWRKVKDDDGAEITWSFQSECTEEGTGKKSHDDGLESMDEDAIITTKRRRTNVDYVRMNKQMGGKGPKRTTERTASEFLAAHSAPEPEPERVPKAEPKVEVPLTEDDVAAAAEELQAAGKELKPRRYMLPLLTKLQHFEMTIDVLTSTKIGKALHPYRKHEDQVISKQVSVVISKWKALIKR